jgi:redox-sensitive bicupin YhaK (pirin superfamily)
LTFSDQPASASHHQISEGLIVSRRTIKAIHPAIREDIADLHTYRAMPTPHLQHIDPFLFLNHHGWQSYPRNNNGLPFGPHPHRGFETVTFILEGDIAHRDSGGHESVIGAQGVQWMTAGRGLIHSETSSDIFMEEGGPMEILQLWVNLPARLKMTAPNYVGLQGDEIPVYAVGGTSDDRASVQLISGEWNGHRGPITPLVDITTMKLDLRNGAVFSVDIPVDHNIFFYVVRGTLEVNGRAVEKRNTVEFSGDGERLDLVAAGDAVVLLCHARPFGEPIVSYGPFVMNTREEIQQAIGDYQAGRFN